MEELQFVDRVKVYLESVGWESFILKRPHTYDRITLDFLSTLEVDIDARNLNDAGSIKFSFGNTSYTFNVHDFNQLLGLQDEGDRCIPYGEWRTKAWVTLTDRHGYEARRSKSSNLKDPVLRYLHRVMATSIFGRGDSTGVVSLNELYLLWCMHNRTKVNTGTFIIAHLVNVAKATTGKIAVGGIISIIAQAVGVRSLGRQIIGPERIDIDTLVAMGMIERDVRGYIFFGERRYYDRREMGKRLHEGSDDEEDEENLGMDAQEEGGPSTTAPSSHQHASSTSTEEILVRLENFQIQTNLKLDNISQVQARQDEKFQALMEEMRAMREEFRRNNTKDTPPGTSSPH